MEASFRQLLKIIILSIFVLAGIDFLGILELPWWFILSPILGPVVILITITVLVLLFHEKLK